MRNATSEVPCEVAIMRPVSGDDEEEIVIEIKIPGERKMYASLTLADFALVITGRGGIQGRFCERILPKRTN